MDTLIYHNPLCGTSRNTLALIRHFGIEPRIILYLETPPSRLELLDLIATMGITVRDVLRQKGDAYDTLNARFELNHAKWDDEALLSLMLEHPILINRPIVVTPKGTRLCRPSEAVLDLLPTPPKRAFIKEDGIVIFDDQGQFVAPKV